jgi:L-alanine-DL-glutamate epimerase-like enolase superfamily enzyme
MVITSFDIEDSIMRKDDPNWRFALGASPLVEGLILRITSKDGVRGHGYASSTPHMGSHPSTMRAELEFFRNSVVGRDPTDIAAIMHDLDRKFRGASQSKAAIDCALHDLLAVSLNVPLNTLFGGVVRRSVPILRILAIKTPQEMALNAQKLVDKGVRYLKIKVHGDIQEDVACVAAIRAQVGEAIHLTIDANQSYNPKDAIRAINLMAKYNIELVEQPVHADDYEGLAFVTRMVPVTVEADEGAGSLKEIYQIASRHLADAVSLKIPKLGGLRNTLAAARICEAAGIKYRFGAAVGSRLMTAQGLHLACALTGVDYACEFGEFDRLLDDPFEGIEIENGDITLPRGPGSGVRPIADNKPRATR